MELSWSDINTSIFETALIDKRDRYGDRHYFKNCDYLWLSATTNHIFYIYAQFIFLTLRVKVNHLSVKYKSRYSFPLLNQTKQILCKAEWLFPNIDIFKRIFSKDRRIFISDYRLWLPMQVGDVHLINNNLLNCSMLLNKSIRSLSGLQTKCLFSLI